MIARVALVIALALVTTASTARATCSCMLRRPRPVTQQRSIVDDKSYNPASAVFLLRDGTRTVMTIEAAYEGPAVELSLVIPVPTSIARENVRTASGTVFRRLDQRTAPRVRHVWPACRPRLPMRMAAAGDGMGSGGRAASREQVFDEYGVEIQDEWAVDEYDITLLGANESAGLFAFLRERGLDLPERAVTVLRAYIETGHRFVLATVDPSRANRLGDTMMLSPIQIEYESTELRVPVRLGTLNSPGEQELLLYVLSTDGRYELANRPNVEAPTDIRMRASARGSFAELYNSITDELFRRTPGAAVVEYAHVLGRHVPRGDVRALGLDDRAARGRSSRGDGREWTLTRIRHRYGTELDDDLALRAAPPLRLTRRWRYPQLRTFGRSDQSAFHVQYVVEHRGCADEWSQRRIARRWATSESMWEARHDLWPGEVLLDPIASLGIEPGSSAPPGWPPPPPEPPAEEPEPVAPEPVEVTPEPAPAAAAAQVSPPESEGLCSASPGARGHAWLALLPALALLALRRRR